MKTIYITEPITWNNAIELAHNKGMMLADFKISEAIIELIETVEPKSYINRSGYLTSTTYQYDTFKMVEPCVDLDAAQSIDSKSTAQKSEKRKAIIIPKDFTILDVEMGKFKIGSFN